MTKVHALSAVPFHINRPWHPLEADDDTYIGPIVFLGSDGVEREATRNAAKIVLHEGLPAGVTVKAWRLP